ncbi:hypothetical protein [Marinomonas atlantica]|uniref:hypothetical protein n=1 Tax=Marinomonas atlantica TaxID=1806668 RepID=UPI0012E8E7E0|nr:hypothetical protein [Marinomonas atlantica]MCO4786640.1 hypothetical protein [Marinomonas atlantica]
MKPALRSILLSLLFLSSSSFAGIDAIFMRDTFYNYELVSEPTLRKMKRDKLMSIRATSKSGLVRYNNILRMTEGENFDFTLPKLNELVFSKKDIIEDIVLATKATNQLLYRLNSVIQKKMKAESNDVSFDIIINGGHIKNRGQQCKIGQQTLTFTPGALAVVRLYCDLDNFGLVESYSTMALDLSLRVHVNKNTHLTSSDRTLLRLNSYEIGSYSGTITETFLNYSVRPSQL